MAAPVGLCVFVWLYLPLCVAVGVCLWLRLGLRLRLCLNLCLWLWLRLCLCLCRVPPPQVFDYDRLCPVDDMLGVAEVFFTTEKLETDEKGAQKVGGRDCGRVWGGND